MLSKLLAGRSVALMFFGLLVLRMYQPFRLGATLGGGRMILLRESVFPRSRMGAR
jgi:hypothetical protein